MSHWVRLHHDGRSQRIEIDRIAQVRPKVPGDRERQGAILTLRGRRELAVDEAVDVIRKLLGPVGVSHTRFW